MHRVQQALGARPDEQARAAELLPAEDKELTDHAAVSYTQTCKRDQQHGERANKLQALHDKQDAPALGAITLPTSFLEPT